MYRLNACRVAACGRDVLLSGSARQRMTRAAPVAGAHAWAASTPPEGLPKATQGGPESG